MFSKSKLVSGENHTVRSKIIAKSFHPYNQSIFTRNGNFINKNGNLLKYMHYYNKHEHSYEPYHGEGTIQYLHQNWKFHEEDERKNQRQRDINFDPYQLQQPNCNRIPPFHPNPNEMYNERERRSWNNSNHHNSPSHYDYTKRPHKRRPSHLMDIWRPNHDEDDIRRDRYTYRRSNSPNNRRYEFKPVTFIDRPQTSKFKPSRDYHKNKPSPTRSYTNKVNSDVKYKNSSNPSTSTSTETKPLQDESKSISDGKNAESKSAVGEKANETEPQVTNKIESETAISDTSVESADKKNEPSEDSEAKEKLQEVPSDVSLEAKTVPLPVDDHETAIDIENVLKTLTCHSELITDNATSRMEHSLDADDDVIVINTEDTYLFTIDDIDKSKSYLDSPSLDNYEIVDMNLGSPLPLIEQSNTPCMTQDELLRQLNEEIGDDTTVTKKPDIPLTQLKIVLDSISTKSIDLKTSSPSRNVDDANKSKVTKRSLSQTDGSSDIKKRRMSKSNRRCSTYAESDSPSKIKDRRASVITDRRSSTSSESSGGAKSKNQNAVEESTEVKVNPYYPSLSQYKIPKKKPAFSSPDRPFSSSISELFGEYDKDIDSTKTSTSQEVNKDARTKKGCDEYSKPEKNAASKQEVKDKDNAKTKKCTDHSKPGGAKEKPSTRITSKKSIAKETKVRQKANNVNEATSSVVADKANSKIQKTSPVKDAIKTTEKRIHTKHKSKPSTSVSSKKDVTKSEESKYLIEKKSKKKFSESTKSVKQDASKSEKKSSCTKGIGKSDKKRSTKRSDESKAQIIPVKRRKINSGSDSKQSNLELQTDVNKPSEDEKLDKNQSKVNDKDKCASLTDELLSITQKQPEPTGIINTSETLPDERDERLETNNEKLSVVTSISRAENQSKINDNDKYVSLTDDLLSITANKQSEPRDKIISNDTLPDGRDESLKANHEKFSVVTSMSRSENQCKINDNDKSASLTDDLLSITANKPFEPKDKINSNETLPDGRDEHLKASHEKLPLVTSISRAENQSKDNNNDKSASLNEDLLSITANKHSEPRESLADGRDELLETKHEKLLSLVTSISRAENLTVEETRSEAVKNADANKIDPTDKPAHNDPIDQPHKLDNATLTSSAKESQSIDANRLLELMNKYFPSIMQDQEIICKAPELQKTTTNITEVNKIEEVKKEIPSCPNDIQIKTAVKSEHSELEKVQPLILDPFPASEKLRISLTERDCIEEAFVMDSPDLHQNIEIVIQSNKEKDSEDVIEIKEDITVIDLTDEPEEIVVKEDLLQIIEDMKGDSTEKITLYRSDEAQDNADDEDVQAMSASLLPSTVLRTDNNTKTEPIKSEIKSTGNDNCVNISSQESVESTNTSTEDLQENLVSLAESANEETLPPLLRAKAFLSINKNLFEKDVNDTTEQDTLKNSVEVTAGQTSYSSSIPFISPLETINQNQVELNNQPERWMSGAPVPSSSILTSGNVPNCIIPNADRPQELVSAPSSSPKTVAPAVNRTQEWTGSGAAINSSATVSAANGTRAWTLSDAPFVSFSVSDGAFPSSNQTKQWAARSGAPLPSFSVPNSTGNQTEQWVARNEALSSSLVPNITGPGSNQLEQRTARSVSTSSVTNSIGPVGNQTEQWVARNGTMSSSLVPNITGPGSNQIEQRTERIAASVATCTVPNSTGPVGNQTEQWAARSYASISTFSVPNCTGSINNQTEQWAGRSGASVSSSIIGVNGVPVANQTEQWTRSGVPAVSVSAPNVVNQTQRWTRTGGSVSVGSSSIQQQGSYPLEQLEQWSSKAVNDDHQFGSHNQNRSTGTVSNISTARGNETDQVAPRNHSWHQCMADFVVLAIKNHVLGKQHLNSTPVCPLTYKVEQLVIDLRWKIYGEQIMLFLSNTIIEEMEPIQNMVTIYQRVQSQGMSSLPQFFLCLDAIMSQTKEFYLNHRSLWKFYQLVNANAKEIRLKANKGLKSAPPRPVFTQQQIGMLNYQIEFCNMVTRSYQNKNTETNVPSKPRRSSTNVSNPINGQNSFAAHYNVPLRQTRTTAQVSRNVNQQIPNMYVPQRGNQQSRASTYNTPHPPQSSGTNQNVGNSTSYSYKLKQLEKPSDLSNLSTSTFKVPSQLRYIRKNHPSSSTAVNDTPTNSSSYGMSPAFNASVQNSPSDSNAPSFRRDTPRYAMPSMTHIRKHIYAPMMFTPNYLLENTPSPVTESPINKSPSHESPVSEETPPAMSPINRGPINAPINVSHIIQALKSPPINQSTTNESPIDQTAFNESPVEQPLFNESPTNAIRSPVNVPPASESPTNGPPINESPINPSPVNESVDNDESCDSGTKVNEDDEVVIDLTWLDDFDCDELKQEVDFINIKKEEFDEGEVILNEEHFPLATSPTDSGIESSPSPQVEYSELVYHGRLCICDQPAEYVCKCRLAMYCSNSCQNGDWTQHRRICLKAKSKQTD